ncbi:MAG: crossover junction endodeoxyribonuclease RuvC [Candidatus Omnitrophica bacterium]|nr:crossover junction endodeoxyribonuclease RuvC [Candidatus Omnitrophota bacterium]
MRILGVDPGTRVTGYAFVESVGNHPKILEVGTIEPKSTEPLNKRIHKIYLILDQLIQQFKPEVLVLEKLYSHYKHPATAAIIGHVRGVICLLSAKENVELVEHSVKRIRKAVTGNGNATKVQTRRLVADVFKLDEEKLPLDASDALALSLGYIYMDARKI